MHTAQNASRDLKAVCVQSALITLSAAAATAPYFVCHNRDYVVRSIHILYNVATDANPGVAINVGTRGTAAYFGTATSGVSKSIDAVDTVTLTANTTLTKGTPLFIGCAGSKTGVGQVLVTVELTPVDTKDSAGRLALPL